MKNYMKFKVWPVLAGLLLAFVTMILFEFVNSFFFPFPEGMEVKDIKAFTDNLPWIVYILVLLGWMIGSFLAGYITTRLAREQVFRLSLIVGIILTFLGVVNNLMIGHGMVFNVIGLPMFLIFSYFGHLYWRRVVQKSSDINLS
ncbi:hypothetical protein H6789_00760 [Candidatus Nomurabacteria bacterium]|nr:hypothetical protein [Candidatus Nomurabacteria bacterium]